MEAGELGLYMFFACAFATLLQHPASPVRHFISSSLARRALYGLAIGSTVIGIVMTPWGKQSGGHFNPAITFTFYRLGKVQLWDALFYAAAQFSGATCGVAIATYVLPGAPENGAVRYAVTVPGVYGSVGACWLCFPTPACLRRESGSKRRDPRGRPSRMWGIMLRASCPVTESLPRGTIALEQDEPRPSCSTHSRWRRVPPMNGEWLPKLCRTARRSVARWSWLRYT